MNTRVSILGVAVLTLVLGLACTGGEETTDVGTDGAVPVVPSPVPSPDPVRPRRPRPDRRPGRGNPDGGRNGDDDGGGGGGRPGHKTCTMNDVRSSSALDGHPARDVTDDDPKTAWCEGASGNGVGEEVSWDLADGCAFDRIEVLAGNFKDSASLSQYSRLKRVRVYDKDKPANEVSFDIADPTRLAFEKALDQPEILELPENLTDAKSLAMRIDAVYPGSKFEHGCAASMKLK